MKYINLTHIINHLNFGDELVLNSGKHYSVEQVHDHFWLDVYDDKSELHTLDLRRLFINEKIKTINGEELAKFDHKIMLDNGYKAVNSQSEYYLPLSFKDLKSSVKFEKVYSQMFDVTSQEIVMDSLNWHIAHFVKVYQEVKNDRYNELKNEFGDDVAVVLLSNDIIDENALSKDKETLIFAGVELAFIKKIYFANQISLDRFLGSIRGYEMHNYIKAKCIFDPYLLDETLSGKW